MTNNQSLIVDKVLEAMLEKNIKTPELAKLSGISYSNLHAILKKKRSIGSETIIKLSTALGIPFETLRGLSVNHITYYPPILGEEEQPYNKIVKKNNPENSNSEKGYIPFFDRDVTASKMELFEDKAIPPTHLYYLPNFADCTAIFPIYGDSMYPRFRAGDRVVVKEYPHFTEYIQFGEVYLVFTKNEERMIKIVRKSNQKDTIKLVSVNQDYDDFEIPLKIVTKMFLVKGKISIEND